MNESSARHKKAVVIFSLVVACAAMTVGFSDTILSNYFKDAYQVNSLQRGLIELPLELPGVITFFLISLLSSFSGARISMIAQGLALIGALVLGLTTPTFTFMLVFIFIRSVGGHLWYPLQDSLGMQLIRDEQSAGRTVSRFKSINMACSVLAAGVVFLGFRLGFFSFVTPVKGVFLVSVGFTLATLLLLGYLDCLLQPDKPRIPSQHDEKGQVTMPPKKVRFLFRKQYKYYYLLAIVFGVQKQIMMVYGPWVLIDLLGKKADTMAILSMVASLVGIFFIPLLGRWLDRFGIKKMLYLDAISFILVYTAYGLVSSGFSSGSLLKAGLPVILTFMLFVIDRMSMQMGIFRSLYLRSIAISPDDIAPTLTTGQSMDHVVSIICAALGGLVWGAWGPQYIFYMAAGLSLLNYLVAYKVKVPVKSREPILNITVDD
jgi:MFS family permease